MTPEEQDCIVMSLSMLVKSRTVLDHAGIRDLGEFSEVYKKIVDSVRDPTKKVTAGKWRLVSDEQLNLVKDATTKFCTEGRMCDESEMKKMGHARVFYEALVPMLKNFGVKEKKFCDVIISESKKRKEPPPCIEQDMAGRIKELQKELDNYRRELANCKRELGGYEGKLTKCLLELKQREDQVVQVSKVNQEMNKEMCMYKGVQQTNVQLNMRVQELKTELARSGVNRVNSKVAELEEQNTQLRRMNEKVKQDLAAKTLEVRKKRDVLNELGKLRKENTEIKKLISWSLLEDKWKNSGGPQKIIV
jgi:Mg2+ and Co2+ transporter CorA